MGILPLRRADGSLTLIAPRRRIHTLGATTRRPAGTGARDVRQRRIRVLRHARKARPARQQEGRRRTDTLDTYQWHDGQLSLIGSGDKPRADVLPRLRPHTRTREHRTGSRSRQRVHRHARQALPVQTNSVGNIYDARVCEPESPCIQPPSGETAQCEGGTCQTPPAAAARSRPPRRPTLSSSGRHRHRTAAPHRGHEEDDHGQKGVSGGR